MILVLAGTSEGRLAAVSLEKEGLEVIASTATTYGGELLAKDFKGEITARPLTFAEMVQLITDKKIDKVIDATHPFAVEVSNNVREACQVKNVTYERLERTGEEYVEDEGMFKAKDVEEAVLLASEMEGKITGNIFLATGSSKLEYYVASLDPEKLVVRILPVKESLEKCLELGLSPKNIIAMQGPFDEKINRCLFKRYKASLLITKDSGPTGGTKEKIDAAKGLNIPVILIERPGKVISL